MTEIELEPLHDAMDKSFRYTGDQWIEDFHVNLDLPGETVELLYNDTLKDPKTGIRMDLLELVKLHGGVEIIINIEHQSTKLDSVKIRIIDNYKNYAKCKYNFPVLTIIVSPFPKEKHLSEYRSTQSDVLQPVFITIDDEEIEKRLNILKDNIKNNDIENHIVLNIALISIFVLNNKYEILKTLCEILKNCEGIKGKIKIDMTKVLEEMIKYKLKDNKNQVKELLNMIKEEIEESKRGIKIWYEEEFEQLEAKHEKELNQKENEKNQISTKLEKTENENKKLRNILETNGIII